MQTGTTTNNTGSSGESSLWSGQTPARQRSLLGWWYNLAAPQEPEKSTSQDRERVRAGRLASIILLITFCFGLSQLPDALTDSTHTFLFIVLIAMAINIGVLILNRRGQVIAGGIIIVTTVEIAFILAVLTSSSGLTATLLRSFDLIVLTELIAVSILPPRSVFLVTLCNCLFTWAAITFMPRAASLHITNASSYYSILASPLILQVIVALVTYLWVQGAREAIERAERIAALERALAERDRAAAEQKQQLELGIQQILQAQIQAANGNFEVRAPLARENVLWQVAHSLNTLLARLQRAILSEKELQRTSMEVNRLIEAVRQARARRYPIQALKNGTVLDPLVQELTGNYISQP
jgi:hypothetical protein